MTIELTVENIKCSGCANSIVKKLTSIKGVEEVEVDHENGKVLVNHKEVVGIQDEIIHALEKMGYAQQGKGNFIDKAKSYVSCAIGKMGT